MSDWTEQQDETIRSATAKSKAISGILVETGAILRVPGLLREHFDAAEAVVIADDNTMRAAGKAVTGVLSAQGIEATAKVFPGTPRLKASVENAEAIVSTLRDAGGVPLAVGSGVINDLVKYAAFQLGVPYMSVATAASMDGYASAGSPLTRKGFKHTIPCAAPKVMVADLDVVTRAPKEMSSWGYGDLAGKLPAGADWLIADALGIEPLDGVAWPLVQGHLREWLGNPSGLAAGDAGATGDLFTGLVAAGIAMEVHNSSRPASGAEHQIAHLWEMDGLKSGGEPVSHGACVAIGTLTVLSLYEWLLAQDLRDLDAGEIVGRRRRLPDLEAEIGRRFPDAAIFERTREETRAKYAEDGVLADRMETIRRIWPDLRDRLTAYLPSFEETKGMLAAAGVVTDPAALGIGRNYLRDTLLAARFIRRRYTILDFLEETGCFDRAVEDVFAARWG